MCVGWGGQWGAGVRVRLEWPLLVSARVYTQQLTLSISLMPLVTGIITVLKI